MVLVSQQRCRYQYRDLFSAVYRDECGTHRHFGFTESHVTADDPVHRLCRAHVGYDFINGAFLIRCFFVRKCLGKDSIVVCFFLVGKSGFGGSSCMNFKQFGRDIVCFLCSFAFNFLPLLATQSVQGGRFFRCSCVATDEMQRGNWHIEFVFLCITQCQIFSVRCADIEGHQSDISTHTMVYVYNGCANGEVCEVGNHRIAVTCRTPSATSCLLSTCA